MRRALTLFDNSVARCRGRRPLGAGVELLAAAQPADGADAAPGDCGGLVDSATIKLPISDTSPLCDSDEGDTRDGVVVGYVHCRQIRRGGDQAVGAPHHCCRFRSAMRAGK